jgi:hypothetical protein
MREELPARVQEALGELAAAAREGLLALSVSVGLGVGYRDLAKLAVAIERDVAHTTLVAFPAEEAGAAKRRTPVVPFAPVA